MSKTLIFIYRFLGIIVSLFSYLMLFMVMTAIFQAGMQGSLALGLFMTAAMVIYSILSGVFGRLVLLMGQPMRHSLKDWIKVNAIVTLIFAGLATASLTITQLYPDLLREGFQRYPPEMRPTEEMLKTLQPLLRGVLAASVVALAHCIWTLLLVRRYRESFK